MPNIPHNQNQSLTYPAVYVIFTLLHAIRRGIERRNMWREFRRQGVVLKPKLSFWIAVCEEAGLIKLDGGWRVTGYARRLLNKTPEEQAFHLIEAWQNAPKNRKVRMFRRKLSWKLKYDKPLTQKDRGALNGLDALGLTANGKLTNWGKYFVKGEGVLPSPKLEEPCRIHEDQFIAPLPRHIDLLWELETWLRPTSPGVYPLTNRALHFYEGDPYLLIELLERGLGKSLPGQTKAILLKQPSIRIAGGIMLEFSSPAELKQLRRQPIFRRYIDKFLSPQRVLVSNDKSKSLLQMLSRRGVYIHRNEEQIEAAMKRTHFRQKPETLLKPAGKGAPILDVIEKYKQMGLALDILYHAPGYPAEQRRITPLLVEERGGLTYVIAYCQTRRAQRTFRLDRMEIPGAW